MANYESFEEIVASNRLFVFHGGYYFTLNGHFYTTELPKGSDSFAIEPISSLPEQSVLESLAPEIEVAMRIYSREVNNKESKYLLAQGTTYILDVGEGRMARCIEGFIHESALDPDQVGWVKRGYAEHKDNYISVDKPEYGENAELFGLSEERGARKVFREENTHLLDSRARIAFGIDSHYHGISHHMLSDEVRQASVDNMQALDRDYRDFEFLNVILRGKKTDKPILDQLFQEYNL